MTASVIICKGLPGSGKTTWARREIGKNNGRAKRISRDDILSMLDNGIGTEPNKEFALNIRDRIILQCIRNNLVAIVDDCNLNPIHEIHIRKLIGPNVPVDIKDFTNVDVQTCIDNDVKRSIGQPKGEATIRRLAKEWERWKLLSTDVEFTVQSMGFSYDFTSTLKPPAVICDLDGTLAHNPNRAPNDFALVGDDQVDDYVLHLLKLMSNDGLKIIIVTGRELWCKEDTCLWLDQHRVPYNAIFMRPSGDFRDDVAIKSEIYKAYIEPSFSVFMVLDDRSKIVQMWRDNFGLRCFQVAWGDF